MPRKSLTMKQKAFVSNYTNKNNPETYGNGVQSILNSYNVSNYETANAVAVENLQKPAIQKAIELKTRSKEQIENSLVSISEKLEQASHEDISVNNAPIIRLSLDHNMALAKLNGLLIDKQVNINVGIDATSDEIKDRLKELWT